MSDLSALSALKLNEQRFETLLKKLIGEAEGLQNQPGAGLIPRENNASDHVLAALEPHSSKNGGPLNIERVEFHEGRGNVIITYKGETDASLAIMGSHLDVVPANPETWDRDPFTCTREGDNFYGRGTTDCLGHVAMVTEFLLQLAEQKPKLKRTVTIIFIASEENGEIQGVGVDKLMETGKMDHIKKGPVIWVDCSDTQPCIGTAGAVVWHLKAVGKLFHSGLPHKGINSLEMVQDSLRIIQDRFYADFPPDPLESKYNYATPSTMKPTQCSTPSTAINQLPPWAQMSGDIRLTPFYKVDDVKAKVEQYVADINANLWSLEPTRGPCSKYTLPTGEVGKLELTWGEGAMAGIACSLDSEGYHALCAATKAVVGECKPYSICGSLPLVAEMQEGGFDVQLTGYGLSSTYHADNEYCTLKGMEDGFRILMDVLVRLEKQ